MSSFPIFADKIQVEAFQKHIVNQIVDTYLEGFFKPMNLTSVLQTYNEMPETSSLQRLAVAIYEPVTPDRFENPFVGKQLEDVPISAAGFILSLVESGPSVKVCTPLKAEDFYEQKNASGNSKLGDAYACYPLSRGTESLHHEPKL